MQHFRWHDDEDFSEDYAVHDDDDDDDDDDDETNKLVHSHAECST